MNTTIFFVLLSIFNVITSTIKSILTVKGNKWVASATNAIYYGYYTYVAVLTVTLDFALRQKVLIVTACNLIGVFIVKLIEEKSRKDKLWKIESTIPALCGNAQTMSAELRQLHIPHNYLIDETNKYAIFNIYSATQKESHIIKSVIDKYDGKYFVSESKNLY